MTTLIMGVVNVTPDSFSDGGMWFAPDAAVAHGMELLEQGADILDVGGESTRPGAERPSQEEELRRVLPVIRELARRGARVSVDTMRGSVAAQAIEAGESSGESVRALIHSMVEPVAPVDYADVVDAATLQRVEPLAGELRLLIAARFGKARLIDNIGVTAGSA